MATAELRASRAATGLDALEVAAAGGPSRARRLVSAALPKVVAVAVLLATWQMVVLLHLRPTYVIPAPGDVWQSLSTQYAEGNVLGSIWTSLHRAAIGFAASILIGTPLGFAIARFRPLRLAIGSVVAGLQSLPSVTWVPVGIVWFGLSESTIYFVVIMGALPSIANGVVTSVDHIPPLLVRAARTMGARGLAMYWHVVLPAALPGYVAGLKQAWSFSWRSLMAAELITFSPDLGLGLGQLLDSGKELSDMSLVLVSVLLILAVGVAVDGLVFGPLDRGIRRRRGLSSV